MTIASVSRRKKFISRKQGDLENSLQTLAYDRIIELPFDLATIYAAAQNFRIDLAKGFHPNMQAWDLLHREYFDEALHLLQEDGCNLFPGDNNEPWIHAKTTGTASMPSARCCKLAGLFTDIFARNDVTLLGSDFYPDPRKVITSRQIERLMMKLHRKYNYH